MYHVFFSNQYKKSLKLISRHKDFDVGKHKEIVRSLKSGDVLNQKYKDHELKGEYSGIRECHIQNDILLLYRKDKDVLILILVDIGTHSYLFE